VSLVLSLLGSGEGSDTCAMQDLLGHRAIKSTMVHAHVLKRGGRGIRRPGETTSEEFWSPPRDRLSAVAD
jgi:hypothetical protein